MGKVFKTCIIFNKMENVFKQYTMKKQVIQQLLSSQFSLKVGIYIKNEKEKMPTFEKALITDSSIRTE